MERLAASRRTQAEEVGVVGQLLLSFLSCNVDGYGHALTVGIVDLQRGVLIVNDALLVHQAGGSIAEGEESVVVSIHAIAVAGEGVDEQLQLVVGSLADMDAHAREGVFEMVGAFLYVGVAAHCHHEVVVGIDELLALPRYHLLHSLDVLHSHQVAGVGHGGMAVFLLVEQGKLTLLVGHEHHLVEHHAVGSGHTIDDAHEVNGHTGVVHLDIGIGTDDRRQVGAIHIYKAIHLAAAVAHADGLVIDLEVGHRHHLVTEVHGEEAVHILVSFCLAEEAGLHTCIPQLVVHLAYLHQEVAPFLVVERHQAALLILLCDGEVADAVGKWSAVEIAEVALAQKLMISRTLFLERLPHKHILLVHGIAFAQGLGKGSEEVSKLIVGLDVGGILLHGVLHLQHGGVFARLGIEHADAIHFLDGEVDVLEDALALPSRAECLDTDGHAHADG